jgi:hypothetical protein
LGFVGNQPPRHFLSRSAIDQTQNINLDLKVRIERHRNEHRGQETGALKTAEPEHQSRQKRESQPRPSATVIQMKLMKVICMIENRMVQEYQHCTESQLIEAMTMKIHLIQFASSVTGIQMKLMKVICTIKNRMVQEFQSMIEL